jgi:hypothetical protein
MPDPDMALDKIYHPAGKGARPDTAEIADPRVEPEINAAGRGIGGAAQNPPAPKPRRWVTS